MAGPLAGIIVLDFARYIAGPYCATLLGALGADVIRVEKPGGGEDRYIAPITGDASALFMQTGMNKRSVTLDLKHPRAAGVVARLVARADVVVANMPPKVLARMGLDYATLCAIKPDIILTTQTAFGHAGPWAERGGFDGLGQVMSGAAWFSGTPGQPQRAAAPYVDYTTAILGAFGTLAALYDRRTSGRGQHIQASLLGSALTLFNGPLIEQAVAALNRAPSGNRGQTSAPTDLFATRDGHIITQVLGQGLFERLARAIGASEWLDHADYDSDEKRGDRRDEICARTADWCRTRTSSEVIETLGRAGVPCGPVLDLDAALAHEQTRAMAFFNAIDYPGLERPAPVARAPLAFSSLETRQARAPRIGEHTDAVLADAGYAADDIADLRASGVV